MKKVISVVILSAIAFSAGAAPYGAPAPERGRRASMAGQMMKGPQPQLQPQLQPQQNDPYQVSQERAGVASKNQISATATLTPDTAVVQKSSTKVDNNVNDNINADLAVNPEEMISAQKKDMREKEKGACIANNIGIGNTFVWASRYSNINNYSTMVEDIENPENNTCFVKVELKSNDSKIGVSDVPSKYFEWGQNIACGSWADYDVLKKRILDAKKSARTWATVGGAVVGAGVGVGAMELFGNKMIGGSVQGQKALEGDQLLRSQLAVLKKDNESDYKKFISNLKVLKTECAKDHVVNADDVELKSMYDEFKGLFDLAV